MFKRDKFLLGIAEGLVAPLIGLVLYKTIKFKVLTVKEFFQYIVFDPSKQALTSMVTVSLFLNAVLFTVYVNRRLDKTAKGIFAMTCIYAIVILVFKLMYS
jgi:hypothetical protein